MPKIPIPQYQQQNGPALNAPVSRAPGVAVQDNTGQALAQVGGALKLGADVLEQQNQEDARAWVSQASSTDYVKWQNRMTELQNNARPGAPDFTPTLLTEFDNYAKEAIGNAPDAASKRYYQAQLGNLRQTLGASAVRWEAGQRQDQRVSQYQSANEADALAVSRDPSHYLDRAASAQATLSTSKLPPDVRQKLMTDSKHTIAYAAGLRMVNDDPQAALSALTLSPDQKPPAGYEWVNNLQPQRALVLQNHANTLVNQIQNRAVAEQNARETQGVKTYNSALDLFTQGKQFSPEFQNQLLTETAGTSSSADAQKLIYEASSMSGFASKSLAEMRGELHGYQATANTPGQGTDPATMAAIKQRQQIYTASVEAYTKDPWNAALDRGRIGTLPPVDTTSPQNLVSSLAGRASIAPLVDSAAGRPVSLLTNDEADSVLRTVNALPIDQRAQLVNQIGGAFGGAGRIGDLAKQWKEKDESMSLALKAGAGGGNGNPLVTTSGTPVSAFILSGQQAIKDKTVKVEDIAGSGLNSQIATKINGVLPAEQEADSKRMAYYIAIGSAARNGRTAPNSTDIENGINAATGGITNTGGTRFNGEPNRVAMPYGWTESQFSDSVKAAGTGNIENTVNGAPIGAVYVGRDEIPAADFMKKFASYKLVRVGVRGTYAVQAGQHFVNDVMGRPVTVHLNLGQQATPTAVAPAAQVDNPFGG
ncbi:hypothetical protein [Pandoraea sp. NPDC090278]|uniref:hypothetical protein n=1 Tax=Pandoraea sp. NPDC090278 TaxID=3364391 RepID=UPI00383B3925